MKGRVIDTPQRNGEHGIYKAELAQSVERAPFKRVVLGSSPRFGKEKRG